MTYLEKHALYPPLITDLPASNLGLVVVIPAFNEEGIKESLAALAACEEPDCAVEVIIVVNYGEAVDEAVKALNQAIYEDCVSWAEAHNRPEMRFCPLLCGDLPKKQAGVGMARKIGMDEAVRRLGQVSREDGVILCFDADTLCERNYLKAVASHFQQFPKCPAVGIRYAHPIEGDQFEPSVYDAIVEYELHLRYYQLAKKWCGFPFAYETIGSAMAVRSVAYQAQGGMNKRKAGEDFYFLNKFTVLDHFQEINATCLIPSPRPSDRVPFGTGRSIANQLQSQQALLSYAPQSFLDLKQAFDQLPDWYQKATPTLDQCSPILQTFFEQINFQTRWQAIKKHTSNFESFHKRFYRWFNAFLIMKYVHFARTEGQVDVPVVDAARWLLKELKSEKATADLNKRDLLQAFRQLI